MKILLYYGITKYMHKLAHLYRLILNVNACGCDSLYRSITQFSFLLFKSNGLYTLMKLSAVFFI